SVKEFKTGLHVPFFFVVKRFQNFLYLASAILGSKCCTNLIRKSNEANAVVFFKSHIGDRQTAVNGIIEVRHIAKRHLHSAPFTYNAIHILAALFLILIYHQLPGLAGGFPIYISIVIAFHEGRDLLKFIALANSLITLCTLLCRNSAKGEKFELVHLRNTWVNRDVLSYRKDYFASYKVHRTF